MSASLVGSEMCIRDSAHTQISTSSLQSRPSPSRQPNWKSQVRDRRGRCQSPGGPVDARATRA
eukprot:8080550-Alexandrium_andersonii.AAC.1